MTSKDSFTLSVPEAVFTEAAPVLRVLGHPDRLRIIDVLSRRETPVVELADLLKLAPNAVSQHLNMMLARGIVRRNRRGRRVFYEVIHPAAKSLLECMRQNACGQQPSR